MASNWLADFIQLLFANLFRTGFCDTDLKNQLPVITDTALNNLFWKAYSEARFDEAMEYGENYNAMAGKDNDENKTFIALTNMFALYRQTGNYEKSFAYAQQLYDIALKQNNRQWIASSLWGLGELYKWIDDYPAAINYYRRAREMSNDGSERSAYLSRFRNPF